MDLGIKNCLNCNQEIKIKINRDLDRKKLCSPCHISLENQLRGGQYSSSI